MNKLIGIILVLIILGGSVYVVFTQRFGEGTTKPIPQTEIKSFAECAAAGFPILESYPEQCKLPDGTTFVRDIGNELEFSDKIVISNPRPGQTITSPLNVSGQTVGNWLFEATAPVRVESESGEILGNGYIEAKGEWMTTEFVPVEGTITFSAQGHTSGKLIFEKSNPSGLPEQAAEMVMPVVFKP